MSIETEIKDLTKAIEANTAAIMATKSVEVENTTVKKPEAKKSAAKKPETTKKPAAAAAVADDEVHTLESVKKLATALIAFGTIERTEVKKMITKLGAESLKDLDADGLAALGVHLEGL